MKDLPQPRQALLPDDVSLVYLGAVGIVYCGRLKLEVTSKLLCDRQPQCNRAAGSRSAMALATCLACS
jgi:hypothetical protein